MKKKTNKKIVALEVKNFSKKYRGRDNYAVKNASFVVNKGEFHGFIGANGAGKTTSIKSIIGAYAKFEGNINVFGNSHNSKEAKIKIGYIPEKADFPKGMPLAKYLKAMANLSGFSLKEAGKFADEKIKEFGLEKVRKQSPNSFSSGQKKKVLLAQSLVANPELIIMDEPAANLDPKARDEFFEDLKRLQKQGKTIFISSHILTELEQFVDSITILDNGSVVYNGAVKDLQKQKNTILNYEFNSSADATKFTKIANTLKLEYKVEGKNASVKFKSKKQSYETTQKLFRNNVNITQFYRERITLQGIYNSFVKFGSVDTPEHLKNMKGK